MLPALKPAIEVVPGCDIQSTGRANEQSNRLQFRCDRRTRRRIYVDAFPDVSAKTVHLVAASPGRICPVDEPHRHRLHLVLPGAEFFGQIGSHPVWRVEAIPQGNTVLHRLSAGRVYRRYRIERDKHYLQDADLRFLDLSVLVTSVLIRHAGFLTTIFGKIVQLQKNSAIIFLLSKGEIHDRLG